jgi:7,8-dihydroneopterin aldolase/epimerase/oxygenase
MSQKIEIRGLRVYGFHGVLDFEREDGQYFVIDAKIWVDSDRAENSDLIEDTVSYAEIAELIAKNVRQDPVNLLETLAKRLADLVLIVSQPHAKKVKIKVSKPDAPIQLYFDDVSVTATVRRDA